MTPQTLASAQAWALVRAQYGVIARWQLLGLGYSAEGILHRLRRGRIHEIYRGVYAVGRPEVTQPGRWMAALLACGTGAVLSGISAAMLWGILPVRPGPIHVTLPARKTRSRGGIRVTSRSLSDRDTTTRHRIPVTTPIRTLVDLALSLKDSDLERAINEADKLDLVDPETLRRALDDYRGVPGVRRLRKLLDRQTFTLTDSALERLFLPIARTAGLPKPISQARVNGFRVDFYWPELGLVVETDGLRYHRTPSQQAKDHARDQAHAAAGLAHIRFTHSQIKFEPDRVERVLGAFTQRRRQEPGAA